MPKTYQTQIGDRIFETATKGRMGIFILSGATITSYNEGKTFEAMHRVGRVMAYRIPNGNYIYSEKRTGYVFEVVNNKYVQR